LVIDSEGFGGMDNKSNANMDKDIFLLAILLSSYLIYNTNENITEQ